MPSTFYLITLPCNPLSTSIPHLITKSPSPFTLHSTDISGLVFQNSDMPDYMDGHEEYEAFIEVAHLHMQNETNIEQLKLSAMQMKEGLGSEKQISVDPISLRDSVSSGTTAKELDDLPVPHLKPPPKPKFLSYSLPNSATSSPKFGSTMLKKKTRNLNQVPSLTTNPFHRQDSIALANLERLREIHLRRSKSCGEGRASAPSEEFDLWLTKTKSMKRDRSRSHGHSTNNHCKAEMKVEETKNDAETMETCDEKFKCGALCLFLPGLGRAKPVKARKEEPEPEILPSNEPEAGHVVSKRVSLEKFECGSWRSSTIIDDSEADKDASNLFYDLPLEMIRCSVSDTHSPVTAAFVFDKDRKGVLKKSSSRTTPKKSSDSSRHVRFSTSSPKSYPASPTSSVTPRLQKAREDFNAFLEAQTA